jgi:alpha-1,3-rhamnosyl/mannosyltransferase
VIFRGYVERAELLRLYATCALVAVPSRYEGFGYAAAQALCAGVPVIASDQASLPEVIDGGAPIAAADSTEEWRHAISAILQDPAAAQKHAQTQRERAIARFSWGASACAMLRVYESALINR